MSAPMIEYPGERTDLSCPECHAPMQLKSSRFGPFYSCSTWSTTQCRGSHGAHPDGSPLGVPADAETKAARIRAHDAFDPMWQGKGAPMRSRKAAYRWMRDAMGLKKHEAHIGKFTTEQCVLLCDLVDRFMEGSR